MNHSSKLSATRIHYVCVLQELLQIMLLLANTDLGFSLGKNLSVCVDFTLLNQNTIFFMNVVDLIVIRIWEETY